MPAAMSPLARAALDAVQSAWNAGARPWDPDRLADIYTQDALFWGGRPGHSVGSGAIRAYFGSYLGVIQAGTMALVEQEVRELAPGCLLAQGFVDFAFELTVGQSTRSRLRATLVLTLEDQIWKIRQHHFSPTPEAPPLGQS
jgi:uncharacterized protein (TIGR02246 family)